MFENVPTFVTKVLYNILFIFIIYVVIQFIIGKLTYSPFERWWKEYDGDKDLIDFTSFGLFNQNKLVFDLYQEVFNTNKQQINELKINFIQNVLLNRTYAVDSSSGNIYPGRFLKPSHLSKSIAWGEDDEYIWNFNIDLSGYRDMYWYKWICNRNPTSGYDCYPPQPDNPDWAGCSYCEGTSPIIPLSPIKNIYTDSGIGGGFWPHQYGCVDFFDMPQADPKYIIDSSNYEFQRYDLVSNLPCVGQYMYVPGYPGHRGSWAQLFADWGIVYTLRNTKGDSNTPIISDGLNCEGLYPCSYYCNPDTSANTCPKVDFDYDCTRSHRSYPKSYPKSDLNAWIASGNSNGGVGLNFFSSYNIHPESFLLTSWVSGYYNDSKVRKMIFDAYGVQNLLGVGVIGTPSGGWLRFLQGINTKLKKQMMY